MLLWLLLLWRSQVLADLVFSTSLAGMVMVYQDPCTSAPQAHISAPMHYMAALKCRQIQENACTPMMSHSVPEQ